MTQQGDRPLLISWDSRQILKRLWSYAMDRETRATQGAVDCIFSGQIVICLIPPADLVHLFEQ